MYTSEEMIKDMDDAIEKSCKELASKHYGSSFFNNTILWCYDMIAGSKCADALGYDLKWYGINIPYTNIGIGIARKIKRWKSHAKGALSMMAILKKPPNCKTMAVSPPNGTCWPLWRVERPYLAIWMTKSPVEVLTQLRVVVYYLTQCGTDQTNPNSVS